MAKAVSPLRGPAMSAINLTTWIYQDSNTLASSHAMSSRCSYLDKSLSSEALHQTLFLWWVNQDAHKCCAWRWRRKAQLRERQVTPGCYREGLSPKVTQWWCETLLLSSEGWTPEVMLNKVEVKSGLCNPRCRRRGGGPWSCLFTSAGWKERLQFWF